MPKFHYVAHGARRQEAVREHRRRELAERRLRAHRPPAQGASRYGSARGFRQIQLTKKLVKPQEISNLSRQLSAFLQAGVPVIDAIDAIAHETKSAELKAMLPEMTAQLRAGDPFSEVIGANAEHFPSYYPGIIRSAELSGRLDVVLDQLADYMDRDLPTRRRVKSALTYPIILGVMSTVTVSSCSCSCCRSSRTSSRASMPSFRSPRGCCSGWATSCGSRAWLVGLIVVVRDRRFVWLFARTERGHLVRDEWRYGFPCSRASSKRPSSSGSAEF